MCVCVCVCVYICVCTCVSVFTAEKHLENCIFGSKQSIGNVSPGTFLVKIIDRN